MSFLRWCYTAWKVSVFGVILVRIFPHSDWIRRDTKQTQRSEVWNHQSMGISWLLRCCLDHETVSPKLYLPYICLSSISSCEFICNIPPHNFFIEYLLAAAPVRIYSLDDSLDFFGLPEKPRRKLGKTFVVFPKSIKKSILLIYNHSQVISLQSPILWQINNPNKINSSLVELYEIFYTFLSFLLPESVTRKCSKENCSKNFPRIAYLLQALDLQHF